MVIRDFASYFGGFGILFIPAALALSMGLVVFKAINEAACGEYFPVVPCSLALGLAVSTFASLADR